MAIARFGVGAGNGTEANGASLDLVCPATVNANDILIAHVMHTGTTTNPSTPAGWTLLYPDPADVTVGANIGTGTAAGRHWVFGKLAAGTEDGATVGFGTGGGTNGRAGRIYSFSGYVSGTITDVAPFASFSSIPHATDPQGPTVTTTVVGALAIALMAQTDNNNEEAIVNMTGGTWGDYLEFVSTTLGPGGLSMFYDSCTPTANPGTVTGGAITAANDPAGTIGFEIRPSVPIAVTPTTLGLTLTTFAPTVAVTNNITVATLTATALVLATFAPTVVAVNPVAITTEPATALTLATFASTVATPQVVPTLAATALALTTFAPTVRTPVALTPTPATLSLNVFLPTVATPLLITPQTLGLTLTTFVPSIATGSVVAAMDPGTVPVRYIVGETANVVPVETVAVWAIGVVLVREFVGPANVVPVRETNTEVPRVKVLKA